MKSRYDLGLAEREKQAVAASHELHKALWREHPRIMTNLGARKPMDIIR